MAVAPALAMHCIARSSSIHLVRQPGIIDQPQAEVGGQPANSIARRDTNGDYEKRIQ